MATGERNRKLNDCVTVKDVLHWVLYHPLWEHPTGSSLGGHWRMITYDFVYVNPENETIEDDDTLNTAFRVWIEAGGWETDHQGTLCKCWDPGLDCWGPTMEIALLELAWRVDMRYDECGRMRPDRETLIPTELADALIDALITD